jgi:plasmid stabilization system protein ParE
VSTNSTEEREQSSTLTSYFVARARNMRDDKVQLLWSGEAESDLFAIWSQGVARWSEEKAAEHLLEIQKTVSRLLRNPMLGRNRDEVMVGSRRRARLPRT